MDMRDLLKQLDSIGSDIAEESVDEAVEEKKSSDEMVEEVVGPKEPIYDLLDQLGDNAEAKLLHDLIRYLDAAVIKDFVDEFRSNYDYGKGIEYEDINEAMVSLDQGREYFFDKHDFADENVQGEYEKMASKMSPKDAEILKKELEEFYPDVTFESLNEAMVSLDKGREYFFKRHDFGDENIAYEFNKLAKRMSPEDAEILKKELLDMYGDDVGLDEGTVSEADVQETVEVAIDDLRSLLDLAGLNPQETTQATTELGEYANSPDEDYQDTDVQLNKMSGGLNGPKGQHKKEYPGDNPLAAELAEKLKAMLEK